MVIETLQKLKGPHFRGLKHCISSGWNGGGSTVFLGVRMEGILLLGGQNGGDIVQAVILYSQHNFLFTHILTYILPGCQ